MNIKKFALSVLAILTLTASVSAQAGNQGGNQAAKNVRKPISSQDMSNYVVSARAGVINFVEGEVNVIRARPFAPAEMLISGDELKPGDTLKTGTNGRAEILLNPGCYLRLGNESQFVFLFDNNTSNKVKLLSGSAVIEASAMDGYMFVETPEAKFEIVATGVYRFNAGAGAPEIIVRKGRALMPGATIKENRQATVVDGTALIAKANKQDVDELDDWSKSRAKTLIASNRSLSSKAMKSTTGMALISNAWIYDPFFRSYTFLPYTGGFSSPYGWGYSVCNPYWYRYGWPGYYNGSNGYGSSAGRGGSSGSGGSGSGSGGGTAGGGHRQHHDPPRLPSPVFNIPDRGAGGGARGADRETAAPHHRRP